MFRFDVRGYLVGQRTQICCKILRRGRAGTRPRSGCCDCSRQCRRPIFMLWCIPNKPRVATHSKTPPPPFPTPEGASGESDSPSPDDNQVHLERNVVRLSTVPLKMSPVPPRISRPTSRITCSSNSVCRNGIHMGCFSDDA